MMTDNQMVVLRRRPRGLPRDADFDLTHGPLTSPGPGEVLVETLLLSIDPAMRGWMDTRPNYLPPVALGDPMRSLGIGRVLESTDPGLPVGGLVRGALGWQSHPTLPAAGLERVDETLGDPAAQLTLYGLPGLTAYFGLHAVAGLRPGETILVSAAAGAVGVIVGQVAKAMGCRVVGVAGGPDKCGWLRELGYDAVIDRLAESDIAGALAAAAPRGYDVYFDNVGGALLDAALLALAPGARIVACGRISQSSRARPEGVRNLGQLIVRRARIEGFVVSDFASRNGEARADLARLAAAGALTYRTQVLQGISRAPEALRLLLQGRNTGKMLVAPQP